MDLSHLANLPQEEYEQARVKLITDMINDAPAHHRLRLLKLQHELENRRKNMTSEDFMQSLFVDIFENLENLDDQFNLVRNTLNRR